MTEVLEGTCLCRSMGNLSYTIICTKLTLSIQYKTKKWKTPERDSIQICNGQRNTEKSRPQSPVALPAEVMNT